MSKDIDQDFNKIVDQLNKTDDLNKIFDLIPYTIKTEIIKEFFKNE